MIARAAIFVALVGCAGGSSSAPPPSVSPLEGCAKRVEEGVSAWSCGDGFVAMDAEVLEPTNDELTRKNLDSFVAGLGDQVIKVDRVDRAPFVVRGVSHGAARARLVAAEKPPFFAAMVVVAKSRTTRVLTCGSRASERTRCEAVLTDLVERAMNAP